MVTGFLYMDFSGIILILGTFIVGFVGAMFLLGYLIGRMQQLSRGNAARLVLLRPYLLTGSALFGLAALGGLTAVVLSSYGREGHDARETADAVTPVILVFLAFLVPVVLVNWRKHLKRIHFPEEVQD